MKAIVTNKMVVLIEPTASARSFISKALKYKDKSKQYQLNRMSKNIFLRNSPTYAKLKQESTGVLYKDLPTGDLVFPSGFFHLLSGPCFQPIEIEDRRSETGKDISLPWVKKPYDLRDYQEEAMWAMVEHKRGIINLATGLGKTLIAVHAIRQIKKKTLVVVPGESVALQFYEQLCKAFGNHKVGMFGGGKKKILDITVGIAASVNNHVELFKDGSLGLIIQDETHHTPADTFYNISKQLGDVGKLFGLTATSYRADGKDILITAGAGDIIVKKDIKWGIDNGWLSKPIFKIQRVATKRVVTTRKDYDHNKLLNYKNHVLNSKPMNDAILGTAKDCLNRGRKLLILVSEIEHGEFLAKELGSVFAQGTDKKSQEYIEKFNKGQLNCIVGTVGKVGEGSDIKVTDALIMASFNASKGIVIQAIGRGLRKQDNKVDCEIYDFIPEGSDMLKRHAEGRIQFYKEITSEVTVI